MKKLVGAAVAALAAVALAAAANAYTNADAQIFSPYRCPEYSTNTNPIVMSDPNTGGRPIVVKFSWVTLQQSQASDFLKYEYGAITVKDANGNTVYSQVWPLGDTASWTAIAPTTVTQGNGNTFNGYGTAHESLLPPLSSGGAGGQATYYLTVDAEVTHAVNDGFGSFPKGKTPAPYAKVTNCAFTVKDFSTTPPGP